MHLERLARDERFERLVETRVDRRVVPGLLRHVSEVADERLKLRGAAVGLEHCLHERVPCAGVRAGRQGIQRIVEQFRKVSLCVEGGLDRLADGAIRVPIEAGFLVLDEGIGDLAARELVDGLERRLGLLCGAFDQLARRLVETGGDEGVLEGLDVNRRRGRLRHPEEHGVQVGGKTVRMVETGVSDLHLTLVALDVQAAELVLARLKLLDFRQIKGLRHLNAASDCAKTAMSAHLFLLPVYSVYTSAGKRLHMPVLYHSPAVYPSQTAPILL